MTTRGGNFFNKSFKCRLFEFRDTIVNNYENKRQYFTRFYNIFLLFHSLFNYLNALVNIIVNVSGVVINLFLEHFNEFVHSLVKFRRGTDYVEIFRR